jgi:hypothetical protein
MAERNALAGDTLMEPITRREGKDLRRLAGVVAYDRELARELTRLEASFSEWLAGRLTPHDVSAAIHAFHDGVARDLWITIGTRSLVRTSIRLSSRREVTQESEDMGNTFEVTRG